MNAEARNGVPPTEMLHRTASCACHWAIALTIVACSPGAFAETLRHNTTRAEIRQTEAAIERFESDVGRLPTTDEGLECLVSNPTGLEGWSGSYIEPSRLIDAWGKSLIYFNPPRYGSARFDLYSAGKNGLDDKGEQDDISNWAGLDPRFYRSDPGWPHVGKVAAIALVLTVGASVLGIRLFRSIRERSI